MVNYDYLEQGIDEGSTMDERNSHFYSTIELRDHIQQGIRIIVHRLIRKLVYSLARIPFEHQLSNIRKQNTPSTKLKSTKQPTANIIIHRPPKHAEKEMSRPTRSKEWQSLK